jgi:hypothetical protein
MNRKHVGPILLIVMLVMPAIGQAETTKIYQKQLLGKQSLTVTRTQVPMDEPTPQQAAETTKWLKENPGISRRSTDHADSYTYVLTSANGKQSKLLWTTKAKTFGPAALPGQISEGSFTVEVLDVAVEDSASLIVLYKQDNFIHANIIQPGSNSSRIQLAWPETRLPVPISGLDGHIVSGKVTGLLRSNNLLVQLTSETKKHFLYRWQNNQWQYISEKTLLTIPPSNPSVLGPP